MPIFSFRIDQTGRPTLERARELDSDAEAVAYAQQLIADWPECTAVVVMADDQLVDRLRPEIARS